MVGGNVSSGRGVSPLVGLLELLAGTGRWNAARTEYQDERSLPSVL